MSETVKLLSQKKAYVGTDGKFLYSTDVNTIALVLYNCTGVPEKTEESPYKEEESSTFTCYGKKYSINKVYEQIHGELPGPILMSRLRDNILPDDQLDPLRLERADINAPLLVFLDKDVYRVLDGNHRLAKAAKLGKRWMRCYVISQDTLDKARI